MPYHRVDVTEEALAESRALNATIEEALRAMPSVEHTPLEQSRGSRAERRGIFGPVEMVDHAEDRAIPGTSGDIPVRVLVPHEVSGVYLHLHGGGWTIGGAWQQDTTLWELATNARVAVVSVDYRLAPEHPFPAGPDDCEEAALWLIDHAGREFGTERLAIGGESAGAHLAALTLLRLRDRHGAHGAFSAANLVFGAYDLGMTPSQRNWGERNLVLSTPVMAWFYDQFLPGLTPEERRAPECSPLWAELASLPPALFSVGECDPLLDDSLFMAARWQAAGNDADLRVYPDSIHGFVAFPTAIARLARADQATWLAAALQPSGMTLAEA